MSATLATRLFHSSILFPSTNALLNKTLLRGTILKACAIVAFFWRTIKSWTLLWYLAVKTYLSTSNEPMS